MKNSQANYPALYTIGVIAPWYLRQSQLPLYEMLINERRVVTNCHRRFGKDTTTMCYVIERCIQEPGLIVRYGAPTISQGYEILSIVFDHLFEYDMSQKPAPSRGGFLFKNGSRIAMFGGKDDAELDKARGAEAHIIVLSEFGFFRHKAKYLLDSILSPQLMTTNGQMIILSTPPRDMTHCYIEEVQKAEAAGRLFKWTIDQSLELGDITKDQHGKIIEDCGGVDTESYKREWRCELIADTSILVIPEAQDDSLFIGEQERPPYYDYEVCMDLGFRDFFAALMGYVDFACSVLVVESEYVDHYKTTGEITGNLKALEEKLGVKPWRRLGDCNDPQQLYDMTKDHKYPVHPISKRQDQTGQGFKDSVINGLRIAISQRKIKIHPRCKNLIAQLRHGIWKENRNDFESTEKLGHLDALMALAYMYDNAMWRKNPYPVIPSGVTVATHYISRDLIEEKDNRGFGALKKIMAKPKR